MKQSHKEIDEEVITANLLYYGRMIYEDLEELLQLENTNLNNSKEYQIIIDRLTIHLSKEQQLLDELGKHIDATENVSLRLTTYSALALSNQDYKEVKIADRINDELTSKINQFYEKFFGIDDDMPQIVENSIVNQLFRKYIIYLQNKLTQETDVRKREDLKRRQFEHAFLIKTIGDEMHLVKYNPENLLILSDDDLAKSLNLSLDQFQEFQQQVLFQYAQSLIYQLVYENDVDSLTEEDQAEYEDSFRKLDFFLGNLESTRFNDLIDLIDYYETEKDMNPEVLQRVKQILTFHLKTRDDIKIIHEKNEPCESIDYEAFDTLVSLINIEEHIFDIFMEFSHLNFHTDHVRINDLLAKLEHYIVFEEKLANKLVINKSERQLEALYKLIEDLLYFRLAKYQENPRTASLITSRLTTIIPDVFGFVQEPAIPLKSYNRIIQNHMLQTIAQFSHFIDNLPNDKIKQISKQILYEEFFAEENLTKDFIAASGQPSMLLLIDNPLSAQLTGYKEMEYAYDKDIVLYNLAQSILDELPIISLDIPSEWESRAHIDAYFKFKLYQLQNIFANISDEHSYDLLSDFENATKQSSEILKIKPKVTKKLRRQLLKAYKNY